MYQYLFLFTIELCSIIWMEHSLFILSLDDGHLGCFHFGIVMYKATMSYLIQTSVWVFIFYCMLYFFF